MKTKREEESPLVCKPPDDERYSTRRPPETEKWLPSMTAEELRFAAKGLVRCALAGHGVGKTWRRLLGVKKDHWVTSDKKDRYGADGAIQGQLAHSPAAKELFDTWKKLDSRKLESLPNLWKSRVLVHSLEGGAALKEWIARCPLQAWCSPKGCALSSQVLRHGGNQGPFILLQIHDHRLRTKRKLSVCLGRAFQQIPPWVMAGGCECPALRSPSVRARPPGAKTAKASSAGISWPLRIAWSIMPQAPLCTGVSEAFAKAFHGAPRGLYVDSHGRKKQVTRSLALRRRGGAAPSPALLVSSLRGVLRSAAGWLMEGMHRRHDASRVPLTSDYGRPPEWSCLLGGIFGEAREETGREPKSFAAHRSPVRLFCHDANGAVYGSSIPATATTQWSRKNLIYGWQSLAGQNGNVLIETMELDAGARLVMEISGGPHAMEALVALCLAVDLMGSGFFRAGRFTSRGFGILRLRPERVTSLAAWYEPTTGDQILWDNTDGSVQTGMSLLVEGLGMGDPLGVLSAWIGSMAKEMESNDAH
ncbi:MAG: hypothetical protein MUF52_17000 [Syntrophobacteraceae bacterium]|nr:hypothetical protein [Syntrophobacteraceae bacterium]